MNGNNDDGFYHGFEESNSTAAHFGGSSGYSRDAASQMDDMLDAYRTAHGMKRKRSSYEYDRYNTSPPPRVSGLDGRYHFGENGTDNASGFGGMGNIQDSSGSDSAKSYAYQRDARAQMDDMINEYKSSQNKSRKPGNGRYSPYLPERFSLSEMKRSSKATYGRDRTGGSGAMAVLRYLTAAAVIIAIVLCIYAAFFS